LKQKKPRISRGFFCELIAGNDETNLDALLGAGAGLKQN
jgi:hypothetical protein